MNWWGLLTFTCVLVRSGNTQSLSSCSEERRAVDLPRCLTEIGNLVEDSENFWFGSSFYQRCPEGLLGVMPGCFLPWSFQIPQSIDSLVFGGLFDPRSLDRYLDVTFTSLPGSYVGCGNEFYSDQTVRFTADPLSSQTINCWDARDTPEVSWRADSSQFYSLLVIDVPYGFIHGVYINIPGSDMNRAEAFKPYHGPLNPFKFGNPYAFILYSQQDRMVADQRFVNSNPGQPYKANEFANVQNLTGPIAINWILAFGDPYSTERQRRLGIVDNCPSVVAEAIREVPRPFIPEEPLFLVHVNVTFDVAPLGFQSCCQVYNQMSGSVTLNPLGDDMVNSGHVADSPTINLIRSILFFNPDTAFTGTVYTLIMVDPDVPFATAGTNERPILHWLVVNIQNGDVISGQEVESYRGPAPPDNKPHYYYFLLYEQNGTVVSDSYHQFTGSSCPGTIATRCLFDINGYVAANNLNLVGATWMVVKNDEFVRYTRMARGTPEADVCERVEGYFQGCIPVSGGLPVTVSAVTITLLFAAFIMRLTI